MTRKYGDKVRFVVEDFGASPLADKFGIDKYPAIFVDDALVSRPEDFYAWGGPGDGKYVPWTDLGKRRLFQSDLQRMIDIRLAGGNVLSLTPTRSDPTERFLPSLALTDLKGKPFTFAQLNGKPVLVEVWATWCPFCLDTLTWLKNMDSSKVSVVSVVVQSERKDVDKLVARLKPPGRVTIGTPELLQAFDGPPAIPTLLVADGKGKIVRVFYGAPKTLHQDIKREIARLQ